MLKAAYQRLVGSPGGAAAPPDYGSVPLSQEDDNVPDSIDIKNSSRRTQSSSDDDTRRRRTWHAIRNSIISTGEGGGGGIGVGGGINIPEFVDIAESVFSDIRSESEESRLIISNEAEEYGLCTAFQRAFPERSFALFVTLIFELPTLFRNR